MSIWNETSLLPYQKLEFSHSVRGGMMVRDQTPILWIVKKVKNTTLDMPGSDTIEYKIH